MDIHIRIRIWSKDRFGDTSNAVARLAAEIGVAEDGIRECIRTGTPPDSATLQLIAEVLGLPFESLEKDFYDTKVYRHLRDPFETFRVSLVKSRVDPEAWDDYELAVKQGDAWLDASAIQIVRVPVLHSVSTPVFSLNFDFPPQEFLPLLFVTAAGDRYFSIQIIGS